MHRVEAYVSARKNYPEPNFIMSAAVGKPCEADFLCSTVWPMRAMLELRCGLARDYSLTESQCALIITTHYLISLLGRLPDRAGPIFG
jgi:hypothetical protein